MCQFSPEKLSSSAGRTENLDTEYSDVKYFLIFSGSGEVLADTLAVLVGAIRENITISRAQVVSLGSSGQGVVSGYVHGAMGPSMGKNAALVALKLGERRAFISSR